MVSAYYATDLNLAGFSGPQENQGRVREDGIFGKIDKMRSESIKYELDLSGKATTFAVHHNKTHYKKILLEQREDHDQKCHLLFIRFKNKKDQVLAELEKSDYRLQREALRSCVEKIYEAKNMPNPQKLILSKSANKFISKLHLNLELEELNKSNNSRLESQIIVERSSTSSQSPESSEEITIQNIKNKFIDDLKLINIERLELIVNENWPFNQNERNEFNLENKDFIEILKFIKENGYENLENPLLMSDKQIEILQSFFSKIIDQQRRNIDNLTTVVSDMEKKIEQTIDITSKISDMQQQIDGLKKERNDD